MTATSLDVLAEHVSSCKGILIGLERDARQRRRIEQRSVDPVTRAATALLIARANKVPVNSVLAEKYASDRTVEAVVRAATGPATTGTPSWAGALASERTGSVLLNAAAPSAFAQLVARSMTVDTQGASSVKLPVRSSTPKVNGSFVGEGEAIPLRKLALDGATLAPRKLGVLSLFSKELAKASAGTIESVIRIAMETDSAVVLDGALFDSAPGSAARPPGLLLGATSAPPAATGTPFEKMVVDLTALAAAVTLPGAATDIVFIVSPARAVTMRLMMPSANAVTVIESGALDDDRIVALDANGFAAMVGAVPTFELSENAVLHEEDTTPLPISAVGAPNVVAAPSRSTFQTATVAIRCLWPVAWTTRGAGCVAFCDGVGW